MEGSGTWKMCLVLEEGGRGREGGSKSGEVEGRSFSTLAEEYGGDL